MRFSKLFAATFLASLTLGSFANAQTTPPAPATTPSTPSPAPTTPAPTTPTPGAPGLTARPITPPTHHRMTMAQRFEAANTSHDGHLTAAQAKAGNFQLVVRNYDQIDTAKKGYVTLDDIKAFARARHRTHPATKAPATPSSISG